MPKLVLNDAELAEGIGLVVLASASQDEFLRTGLSVLTDTTFAYLLFEGVTSEQLADSFLALLQEHYKWFDGSSQPALIAVRTALTEAKVLRQLRNIVVHGNWTRSPFDTGDEPTRRRPWGDQDEGEEALYYCSISKHRRMFTYQIFTVDDLRELAERTRFATRKLAIAGRQALLDLESRGHLTEPVPSFRDIR